MVTVTSTDAVHSSSFKDGSSGGDPIGFLIQTLDGKTIYLAGDTGLFDDMAGLVKADSTWQYCRLVATTPWTQTML